MGMKTCVKFDGSTTFEKNCVLGSRDFNNQDNVRCVKCEAGLTADYENRGCFHQSFLGCAMQASIDNEGCLYCDFEDGYSAWDEYSCIKNTELGKARQVAQPANFKLFKLIKDIAKKQISHLN